MKGISLRWKLCVLGNLPYIGPRIKTLQEVKSRLHSLTFPAYVCCKLFFKILKENSIDEQPLPKQKFKN